MDERLNRRHALMNTDRLAWFHVKPGGARGITECAPLNVGIWSPDCGEMTSQCKPGTEISSPHAKRLVLGSSEP